MRLNLHRYYVVVTFDVNVNDDVDVDVDSEDDDDDDVDSEDDGIDDADGIDDDDDDDDAGVDDDDYDDDNDNYSFYDYYHQILSEYLTLRELSIIRNRVSSLLHDFNADCYQAMDNNIHLESDVEVSS